MDHDKFIEGLHTVAHLNGMNLKDVRQLEDGFTELIFVDEDDDELEQSIDYRLAAEEYRGRLLIEVRTFEKPVGDKPETFYVSPIPYVLFGVMYCKP